MIAMLMMVLVGTFIFELTTQDLHFIGRLKKSLEAQYLAEAGFSHALAVLNEDWDNRTDSSKFPSTSLGTGTFDATVASSGGRYLVTSVGTVQGVERTVSAEVTGPTISALAYILAGGSDIVIQLTAWSSNDITGDIYAVNDIEFSAVPASSSINAH